MVSIEAQSWHTRCLYVCLKGFNYISEFFHCLINHWILVLSWFKISLQYLGIFTSILFISILYSINIQKLSRIQQSSNDMSSKLSPVLMLIVHLSTALDKFWVSDCKETHIFNDGVLIFAAILKRNVQHLKSRGMWKTPTHTYPWVTVHLFLWAWYHGPRTDRNQIALWEIIIVGDLRESRHFVQTELSLQRCHSNLKRGLKEKAAT